MDRLKLILITLVALLTGTSAEAQTYIPGERITSVADLETACGTDGVVVFIYNAGIGASGENHSGFLYSTDDHKLMTDISNRTPSSFSTQKKDSKYLFTINTSGTLFTIRPNNYTQYFNGKGIISWDATQVLSYSGVTNKNGSITGITLDGSTNSGNFDGAFAIGNTFIDYSYNYRYWGGDNSGFVENSEYADPFIIYKAEMSVTEIEAEAENLHNHPYMFCTADDPIGGSHISDRAAFETVYSNYKNGTATVTDLQNAINTWSNSSVVPYYKNAFVRIQSYSHNDLYVEDNSSIYTTGDKALSLTSSGATSDRGIFLHQYYSATDNNPRQPLVNYVTGYFYRGTNGGTETLTKAKDDNESWEPSTVTNIGGPVYISGMDGAQQWVTFKEATDGEAGKSVFSWGLTSQDFHNYLSKDDDGNYVVKTDPYDRRQYIDGNASTITERNAAENATSDDHNFIVHYLTKLPVTLNSVGRKGFFTPVSLTVPSDANVKVYTMGSITVPDNKSTAKSDTGKVVCTAATTVSAGSYIFIMGQPDQVVKFTVNLSQCAADMPVSGNASETGTVMTGATATFTKDYYKVANNNIKFIDIANNAVIYNLGFGGAYHQRTAAFYKFYPLDSRYPYIPAYAPLIRMTKSDYDNLTGSSSSSSARQMPFIMVFDDSGTSGIRDINKDITVENPGAPVYDLSGRRVENPRHGVFIKNGRKFVVR